MAQLSAIDRAYQKSLNWLVGRWNKEVLNSNLIKDEVIIILDNNGPIFSY